MSEPGIEIRRVAKAFMTAGGSVSALHDLSLSVAAGELVALIGPSGCGKSTLLRLVADLDQPDAGELLVRGKPPRQARHDRDYGVVFQTPALYPWRSARANIELPMQVVGWPAARRRARADELLGLVGLADFAAALPPQLSGGMQQRVAIARALALGPAVLLMDEPFGALDEITRERMQQELLAIWAGRSPRPTLLFVTHSIAEAVFLADRVAVLSPRPGRIVREVSVGLPRPRGAHTRADPRFFALVNQVRAALRAA